MTNQEKRNYLWTYRAAHNAVNDLLRERERITALLTKATAAPSGMPRGGGCEGMAEGVSRLAELEADINAKIAELVGTRQEILAVIDTVPDETQRRLLRLRYIEGMRWERVAAQLRIDLRWAFRLHGRALTSIDH